MPLKLLPQCWVSEQVSLWAEPWFPIAFWFSQNWAPLIFKARHYGVLSFWYRSPGQGCLIWGLNPLLLRKDLFICDISPTYGLWCWECGSWLDWLPLWLFYLSQCVLPPTPCLTPYIFSCGRAVLLVYRSFSERVLLSIVIVWACLWDKENSGFSYSTTYRGSSSLDCNRSHLPSGLTIYDSDFFCLLSESARKLAFRLFWG